MFDEDLAVVYVLRLAGCGISLTTGLKWTEFDGSDTAHMTSPVFRVSLLRIWLSMTR